jgi:hypothetical protein
MSGKQQCEICGRTDGSLSRLELPSRVVLLCKDDAERAQLADARSPAALRELFTEADGRRALLPRRAVDERRLFPPRPEGRRRDDGRRSSDVSE